MQNASLQFIITVLISHSGQSGSGSSFHYLVLTKKGLKRATLYSKPKIFTSYQAAAIRLESLQEQGFQAEIEEIEEIQSAEGSPSAIPLLKGTYSFIFCCFLSVSLFAQHFSENANHVLQPLPDTLCFSTKIETYRKNAVQCFYEVKVTCKNCGEETFKNFYFYHRLLFKTLKEALDYIQKAEADCLLYQPERKE